MRPHPPSETAMESPTPFAAVLLAGGRSRRMGRDKALLPLPDGRLLWQRQLAVLEALRPAELFISGPDRTGFPASVIRLDDQTPGLGPLGGIMAALKAMRSPRLVVLAIDLPMMSSDFLSGLLEEDGRGAIPQMDAGFFEPLAAVYPQSALAVAERQIHGADLSMQSFVRCLVEIGDVSARPVKNAERLLFANWNRPEDVAASS